MKTKTGTITATGTGSGVIAPMGTNKPDVAAIAGVSGTFTGITVQVDTQLVGGTLYYPAAMIDRKTGIKSNGSATPADSTATSWLVDSRGCGNVRVSVPSGTPTNVAVEIVSGEKSDFDGPLQFNTLNYTSASSFGAGISFTGATTANTIAMPDNLADALSIVEGATSYITFVTTDGSEQINVKKNLQMTSGTDILFSGTTGQSEITITDNLADGLSIKVSGGADLLVFKTTDSAETLFLGSGGSQFIYNRTGRPMTNGLVNKATITTAGAGTYTAANIISGLILRDPNGSGRTDTTGTAAELVAALVGVAVDDVFDLMIVNTADAAETITLAGGSGVTLVPATITIAQNEIFIGKVRFTNVTGASEAVTIYGGNVAG